MKSVLERAAAYAFAAVKWLPVAMLVGLLGGAVGAAFHHGIRLAISLREANDWLLYLLPVGAILIALLYRLLRLPPDAGTNLVIEAVRSEKQVPVLLAPAMFLSTLLTQLVGGSAGREGAALQIGGGLAGGLARLLRIRDENHHLLVLCGMASVFAALFGTPVAAAVFVLEVASVGHFHYSALLPCVCASATAGWLSRQLGGEIMRLSFPALGETGALLGLQTAALAVLCALLSIGFCVAVHGCDELAGRYLKNSYVRALSLGAAVLALTLLSGTRLYNGASMALIERAVAGEGVDWYAFALKTLFTVTLPMMMPSLIAAAVGMVGMFCGVVNCPFASLFLAVELFGGTQLIPFALTCAISYVFSGYFGLYSRQHILRSKVGTELIDRYVGGNE